MIAPTKDLRGVPALSSEEPARWSDRRRAAPARCVIAPRLSGERQGRWTWWRPERSERGNSSASGCSRQDSRGHGDPVQPDGCCGPRTTQHSLAFYRDSLGPGDCPRTPWRHGLFAGQSLIELAGHGRPRMPGTALRARAAGCATSTPCRRSYADEALRSRGEAQQSLDVARDATSRTLTGDLIFRSGAGVSPAAQGTIGKLVVGRRWLRLKWFVPLPVRAFADRSGMMPTAGGGSAGRWASLLLTVFAVAAGDDQVVGAARRP